jgi:hypothetical protein
VLLSKTNIITVYGKISVTAMCLMGKLMWLDETLVGIPEATSDMKCIIGGGGHRGEMILHHMQLNMFILILRNNAGRKEERLMDIAAAALFRILRLLHLKFSR